MTIDEKLDRIPVIDEKLDRLDEKLDRIEKLLQHDEWVTELEAQRLAHCKRSKLYELRMSGEIVGSKGPGINKYLRESIEDYMRREAS